MSYQRRSAQANFAVNHEGFLIVHADGCCLNNGSPDAQAGIGVYFGPNHPMNFSAPVRGRATNNAAEIQAATHAAYLAKKAGFNRVQINTDSEFVINCMKKWIEGWKQYGWTLLNGSPVVNKQDLLALDRECQGLWVDWNHVRGHTGIEGNEQADWLARQGAMRYTSQY